MKIARTLCLFAVPVLGSAQLYTGTTSSNGVSVFYETRLEPPEPGIVRSGGGILTENNLIKRHTCDYERKTCFGYDLRIDPLPDGKARLTFLPLSITAQKMEEIFPDVKGWTIVSSTGKPTTRELRIGDTIALDLFTNPSTGQKIVDYLRLANQKGSKLTASGASRDFSAEEGALEVSKPRLAINGKEVERSSSYGGGVTGAPIWIYLEGRGRFIFTLASRTDLGFRKAGEIRGSIMTWRWGGDDFSVNTDSRIAPGDGVYNLYVFNDPAYRPRNPEDAKFGFMIGAGGTLESLIRQRP